MPKTCPECCEPFNRSHLPGCSFGPAVEDREAFIREHAVDLVRRLEERVRAQAKSITAMAHRLRLIEKDRDRCLAEYRHYQQLAAEADAAKGGLTVIIEMASNKDDPRRGELRVTGPKPQSEDELANDLARLLTSFFEAARLAEIECLREALTASEAEARLLREELDQTTRDEEDAGRVVQWNREQTIYLHKRRASCDAPALSEVANMMEGDKL